MLRTEKESWFGFVVILNIRKGESTQNLIFSLKPKEFTRSEQHPFIF